MPNIIMPQSGEFSGDASFDLPAPWDSNGPDIRATTVDTLPVLAGSIVTDKDGAYSGAATIVATDENGVDAGSALRLLLFTRTNGVISAFNIPNPLSLNISVGDGNLWTCQFAINGPNLDVIFTGSIGKVVKWKCFSSFMRIGFDD